MSASLCVILLFLIAIKNSYLLQIWAVILEVDLINGAHYTFFFLKKKLCEWCFARLYFCLPPMCLASTGA